MNGAGCASQFFCHSLLEFGRGQANAGRGQQFPAAFSVFAQEPSRAQPEKQQVAKETLTGCVIEAKTTAGATVYVLNNTQGGSAAMYVRPE